MQVLPDQVASSAQVWAESRPQRHCPGSPDKVAVCRMLSLSMSFALGKAKPGWEGEPSREPELCQGTCQEQGGGDESGPALSLCPGLSLPAGIARAHSQGGQEGNTALNVSSTLGTSALLALAVFSHAPLLCICSFPSPPSLPASYLSTNVWKKPAIVFHLYCHDSNNFLSFNLLYEGPALLVQEPHSDLERRAKTLPPLKTTKNIFPGMCRTAKGCLPPCQGACNSVCTAVHSCRNHVVEFSGWFDSKGIQSLIPATLCCPPLTSPFAPSGLQAVGKSREPC